MCVWVFCWKFYLVFGLRLPALLSDSYLAYSNIFQHFFALLKFLNKLAISGVLFGIVFGSGAPRAWQAHRSVRFGVAQRKLESWRCCPGPRLPRETKVDVSKCHACHAKCSYMSPSATPATQKAAASTATAGNGARHQSQPSAIRATPATLRSGVWTSCVWASCVWASGMISSCVWASGVMTSCVWTRCVWTSSVKTSCVWTSSVKTSGVVCEQVVCEQVVWYQIVCEQVVWWQVVCGQVVCGRTSSVKTSCVWTSSVKTSGVMTSGVMTSCVSVSCVWTSSVKTSGVMTSGVMRSGVLTSCVWASCVWVSGMISSCVWAGGVMTSCVMRSGVWTSCGWREGDGRRRRNAEPKTRTPHKDVGKNQCTTPFFLAWILHETGGGIKHVLTLLVVEMVRGIQLFGAMGK